MSKQTAKVKFYNANKGYGFLVPQSGGADIFFHVSGLDTNNPPKEGEIVSYELGADRSGRPNAINVRQVA